MRTVRKWSLTPAFQIQDRVKTARGSGVVTHVFPSLIRGRNTYVVAFENARTGQVFSEGELSRAEGLIAGTPLKTGASAER